VRTEAAEFSDALPNTEKTDAMDIAANASLRIALQEGWHINKDAPSYLALFDMSGKTPKAVASFDLETVQKQKMDIPQLKEGVYRLQGTLYYCEDKEGSQCLIKSFDVPVNVKSSGEKEIMLKLN
jgi:hypothetical protein